MLVLGRFLAERIAAYDNEIAVIVHLFRCDGVAVPVARRGGRYVKRFILRAVKQPLEREKPSWIALSLLAMHFLQTQDISLRSHELRAKNRNPVVQRGPGAPDRLIQVFQVERTYSKRSHGVPRRFVLPHMIRLPPPAVNGSRPAA